MNTLQDRLFENIRIRYPDPSAMADDLAQTLNISKDSIYRRLKGEKPLLYEELMVLLEQYNLSLDALSGNDEKTVIFRGKFLNEEDFDLHAMLSDMASQLTQLSQLHHPLLYYISKDIPVFYYLGNPAACAFKFFVWLRTQFRFTSWENKPFSFSILTDELTKAAGKVTLCYDVIPSVEILNADNILNDLRQIEYYHRTQMISESGDLEIIYAAFHELVEQMERKAAKGSKSGTVSLSVYVNDFYVGDNTVLAETDEVQRVFLNHAAINFMSTDHKAFVRYNQDFIKNLIRRSTLISEVGERTRSRFFHLIHERIEQSRTRTFNDRVCP